jgi:hypothetical protein
MTVTTERRWQMLASHQYLLWAWSYYQKAENRTKVLKLRSNGEIGNLKKLCIARISELIDSNSYHFIYFQFIFPPVSWPVHLLCHQLVSKVSSRI